MNKIPASAAGGEPAGVPIHEHRFAKREEREEVLDVFDAWLERLMEGGA